MSTSRTRWLIYDGLLTCTFLFVKVEKLTNFCGCVRRNKAGATWQAGPRPSGFGVAASARRTVHPGAYKRTADAQSASKYFDWAMCLMAPPATHPHGCGWAARM